MKTLVLSDSKGGNTEKVALRIHQSLKATGQISNLVRVTEDAKIDLDAYDILFLGSPVYAWLPTDAMIGFVKKKMSDYRQQGRIVPASPVKKWKFAVCFCTFSGTHIGEEEAVVATRWLGAFAGHIGYRVIGYWHIAGEFHNRDDLNIKGRLGDIRGRPNARDLKDVENRVKGLIASLVHWQS
ncbi:MAG: flavodoxin [Deltaproteobacteria bacterium]|nr:flavodoxin [Deltaproteobacteria bacterium]MBW1961839.1 flavodoxin [Deltaproteobacteria bacterium]MBW1994505.1 flavodoxin [Deltaproteobacteria bacterium]MBW2152954.1 flavodoxin [Deltaproteobacteria bacterium]